MLEDLKEGPAVCIGWRYWACLHVRESTIRFDEYVLGLNAACENCSVNMACIDNYDPYYLMTDWE